MPQRKNDQTLTDIQMEEMRKQIQPLQKIVNAQHAQLEAQHIQSNDDESSSESSLCLCSLAHSLSRIKTMLNFTRYEVPTIIKTIFLTDLLSLLGK